MLGKNNVNGGGIKLVFSDGHTENVSSVKYEPTTTLPDGYFPIVFKYTDVKNPNNWNTHFIIVYTLSDGTTKQVIVTNQEPNSNNHITYRNTAIYVPYNFDDLETLKKVVSISWTGNNPSEVNTPTITYMMYAKR